MFGWLRQWREARKAEENLRIQEELDRIRLDQERKFKDREKRDLYYGLGFDLDDSEQCWLRQAQLLREHHDRLADLERTVDALRKGGA
jgi:hypothetical protein